MPLAPGGFLPRCEDDQSGHGCPDHNSTTCFCFPKSTRKVSPRQGASVRSSNIAALSACVSVPHSGTNPDLIAAIVSRQPPEQNTPQEYDAALCLHLILACCIPKESLQIRNSVATCSLVDFQHRLLIFQFASTPESVSLGWIPCGPPELGALPPSHTIALGKTSPSSSWSACAATSFNVHPKLVLYMSLPDAPDRSCRRLMSSSITPNLASSADP